MLPVGVPTVYAQFPDWFQTVMNSGISAGCLTAIALNLIFNHLPVKGSSTTPAVVAEKSPEEVA
jgi:NCS2 family nucleobase:cation symporter-2